MAVESDENPSDTSSADAECTIVDDHKKTNSNGSSMWPSADILAWKEEVVRTHFTEKETIDEKFSRLLEGDQELAVVALDTEGLQEVEQKFSSTAGSEEMTEDLRSGGAQMSRTKETTDPLPGLLTSRTKAKKEDLTKTGEDVGDNVRSTLPLVKKWLRPGAHFLRLEGWQSSDTVSRKIKKGRNVSSIILACGLARWEMLSNKCNNEGNAMWRRIWDKLDKLATDSQVTWKGHSSIGHTVRMDFVFSDEEVSRKFLSLSNEMRKRVSREEDVKWQSFSHTESELGWGEEPVLREQDVVDMTQDHVQGNNFFRCFCCEKRILNSKTNFQSLRELSSNARRGRICYLPIQQHLGSQSYVVSKGNLHS